MKINKHAMLQWCDSVEATFNPKENVDLKNQKQIPEQFLAAAIRYLRALCKEE